MLLKTRGIVFKTLKYSESSLIVDVYTEEKGLRKYLVSGVRSKKAKIKASLLQLMSLVDLVVYHRDDKDLTRIKEIRPAYVYQAIPFDLKRGTVGLFISEVARKTIKEAEANPALFEFLFNYFKFLDSTDKGIANLHLYFLLNLSLYLGFLPGDQYSSERPFFDLKEGLFVNATPNHPQYLEEANSAKLHQLMQSSVHNCHEVKFNRADRKALLLQLLDYYRLHIDSFPTINSHQILEEVLEGHQ